MSNYCAKFLFNMLSFFFQSENILNEFVLDIPKYLRV